MTESEVRERAFAMRFTPPRFRQVLIVSSTANFSSSCIGRTRTH